MEKKQITKKYKKIVQSQISLLLLSAYAFLIGLPILPLFGKNYYTGIAIGFFATTTSALLILYLLTRKIHYEEIQ